MKVRLLTDWFGPGAVYYTKADGLAGYIPEAMRKHLPRRAVVLGDDGQPEVAPPPTEETLRDHDLERAMGDALDRVVAEADTLSAMNAPAPSSTRKPRATT